MDAPGRPDPYVVLRFLDRLTERPDWSRSQIQAATRLNYDLFRRYLAFLEERKYVEPGTLTITQAGREARQRIGDVLRTWLQASRL